MPIFGNGGRGGSNFVAMIHDVTRGVRRFGRARRGGLCAKPSRFSQRPDDAGQDYEEMDRLAMSAFAGTTT